MVCYGDDGLLIRAVRIHEGVESDQYRCEKDHQFGIDWPEPADEPQWPPPPELTED